MPAGIAYVDAEERYRFANERIARAFGYSKSEIIGRSTDEVLGPKISSTVRPYLDRGLAGDEVTFEYLTDLPDGRKSRHPKPPCCPIWPTI